MILIKSKKKWIISIAIIILSICVIYKLHSFKTSFDDIISNFFDDNVTFTSISIGSIHDLHNFKYSIDDENKINDFIKYMNNLELHKNNESSPPSNTLPFDSILLMNDANSDSVFIDFSDSTHILINTEHRDPPHQRVNSCTYEVVNGSIDYDYINSLFNK